MYSIFTLVYSVLLFMYIIIHNMYIAIYEYIYGFCSSSFAELGFTKVSIHWDPIILSVHSNATRVDGTNKMEST